MVKSILFTVKMGKMKKWGYGENKKTRKQENRRKWKKTEKAKKAIVDRHVSVCGTYQLKRKVRKGCSRGAR